MPNTFVAIAGILGTLTTAGLGLYFTSRARIAPMRELLYAKQVDLAIRMSRLTGRARTFAALLKPDSNYKVEAREDLRVVAKRYSILCDEAAMLFPTDLYIEVRRIGESISTLLSEYDDHKDIETTRLQLGSGAAKTALMMRVLFGVEELSSETIKLHSKHDQLEKIAEMELSAFQWNPNKGN